MRVALIADWLPTFGGAEHVVAAMHRMWPKAPIFTTVANKQHLEPLLSADIRTSWLQRFYRLLPHHRFMLPFMPRVVEDIDLRGYDMVISSSHAVGKGVIPPSSAVHVCYCHTPMRYAWEMEEQYLKDFGIRGPLKRIVRSQLKRLRRWDLATAKRVDVFIANSTETQERIQRIYGRESIVIAPPVDDKFFQGTSPTPNPSPVGGGAKGWRAHSYFLALGRLVPYKRFDLLIELANAQKLPLKIAGTGHDERRLKAMAGPTVEFLGFVSDSDLPSLYAGASALLFPQLEDAGIVPLEAQASGTPVIAYGHGGVRDVVVDGRTGFLVEDQTVDAFTAAVHKSQHHVWDRHAIRERAREFSLQRFEKDMAAAIADAHARFGRTAYTAGHAARSTVA